MITKAAPSSGSNSASEMAKNQTDHNPGSVGGHLSHGALAMEQPSQQPEEQWYIYIRRVFGLYLHTRGSESVGTIAKLSVSQFEISQDVTQRESRFHDHYSAP